jgi:hypothetical protein
MGGGGAASSVTAGSRIQQSGIIKSNDGFRCMGIVREKSAKLSAIL